MIEVLPAGAVVPAFGLLDAVSQGTLDGGHGVLVYHYGKQPALALWGSGPHSAWTRTCCWPGTNTAAARSCSQKLYASIGAEVVSFPYGPMPTQPLGWFKKPVAESRRPQRAQVPHRRHLDRRVHRDGRRGQRPSGRRDRLRPWTAGCSTRPSSTTRRPTGRWAFPTYRRSACCRASTRTPSSSRSCSTRRSTRRCRDSISRSSPTRSRRHRRTCSGRRSTATRRTIWRCRPRTSVKFYKTPDADPAAAARGLRRGRQEEVGGESAVQGDPRVADRLRQAGDALGAGHGGQPADGGRPLFRAERGREPTLNGSPEPPGRHSARATGWCSVVAQSLELTVGCRP